MTTRLKKLVAAVPRTRMEMEAMVKATVNMQTEREGLVAQRDAARAKADEPFAPRISELETLMSRNVELLEAWSEVNSDSFDGDKSMTVHGHRMGWKLGNWKTELLKKWKWSDVMHSLKLLGRAGVEFIRVKEELLASFGVAVVQEESFYLQPDREGQDPALMTT